MTFKGDSKQYEGRWVSIQSGAIFYIYKSRPNNLRTFDTIELFEKRVLIKPSVDLGMNNGKGVSEISGVEYKYRLIRGIL